MKSEIFKKKLEKGDYAFLAIATISFLPLLFKIYPQYGCNINTNLLVLLLLVIFPPLAFLAYKDFKTFEVDNYTSLILLILFSLLNILLFLLKVDSFAISLTSNWQYLPYQNLLGGIVLGLLFQLLVIVTKERGLGQGDVRIAILCGLLLGFNNLLLWTYITVFTAVAYGLFLSTKRKKFKGTKVPFVPFMVLGIIGTVLYLL